jgi:hypothetical protein
MYTKKFIVQKSLQDGGGRRGHTAAAVDEVRRQFFSPSLIPPVFPLNSCSTLPPFIPPLLVFIYSIAREALRRRDILAVQ